MLGSILDKHIRSIAVESTYNWYWLVDGLMDKGYDVKLANPSAMRQSGIKMSARSILRTGPEGIGKAVWETECMFMGKQNMDTIRFLSEKIKILENRVLERVELRPEHELLTGIPGVGKILALVCRPFN